MAADEGTDKPEGGSLIAPGELCHTTEALPKALIAALAWRRGGRPCLGAC